MSSLLPRLQDPWAAIMFWKSLEQPKACRGSLHSEVMHTAWLKLWELMCWTRMRHWWRRNFGWNSWTARLDAAAMDVESWTLNVEHWTLGYFLKFSCLLCVNSPYPDCGMTSSSLRPLPKLWEWHLTQNLRSVPRLSLTPGPKLRFYIRTLERPPRGLLGVLCQCH